MKRISALLAAACVLMVPVTAMCVDLPSLNVSASVEIFSPSGSLLFVSSPGNPFGETNQAPLTLDRLLGANMTAHWDKNVADSVWLWNGSSYNYAFLCNNLWEGVHPGTSWRWCYWQDTDLIPCASNSTYDISIGEAFWLQNRNTNKTLVIQAEAPSAATTAVQIIPGISLISNPYPTDALLDDLVAVSDGAYAHWNKDLADRIWVWNGTNYNYAFLCNNLWEGVHPGTSWRWCYWQDTDLIPAASNATYTIAPCGGFWYQERGGSFTWNQPKPYTSP